MKFQGPFPSEFPAPTHPIDTKYVYVCVDTGMIPFLAESMKPLLRRSAWKTEAEFLAARQKVLEFKVAMMNGCDAQLIRDGFVLLAKAHGLNYSEALEASMPGLAAALYDAEQADTTSELDAIYRHEQTPAALGYAAGLPSDDPGYDALDTLKQAIADLLTTQQTQQTSDDHANCATLAAVATLLTEGAIPPAQAMTLCQVLKSGIAQGDGTPEWTDALGVLGDLLEAGVGKNTNQNEGYLLQIAELMGGVGILPPVD
jgi:hypothetical protein